MNKTDKEIVLIPLGKSGKHAKAYRSDIERIREDGYTGAWFLNDNGSGSLYVRTARHGLRGTIISVCRLIADAVPGRVVKYRDGDRLNLCRDNLYFEDGFSKDREADLIPEEY